MNDDADELGPSSELGQLTLLTLEGRAALAKGDVQRALALLSRKHERLLRVFPEDSGPVGTSLVDLAEALHLAGRQKESRKAIDYALVIFRRLDRRDEMRERLESALIEICRRQGHTFVVEDLLQDRISEGRCTSSKDDLRRAVDQDELAMMFVRQRQYGKALLLLMDSREVFERAGEVALADLAICYRYIARVYLYTDRFDESVAYGGKAVACARQAHGDDSLEATMVRDELAVAVAFCARRDNDVKKARESLALSESAMRRFEREQGSTGKEAARSWENNRRLKQMLQPLLSIAPELAREPDPPRGTVLPTYSFISHAYADTEALDALLKCLPAYVKPVLFEAINVPPTDFVSEKLINGVLGADGFIFIDNDASHASFWCSFERDLAARNRKHMFRFEPRTRTFEPLQLRPRELKLAHCFHASDCADVQRVMRWLIDDRSFVAFHDEQKLGDQSFPPFASMTEEERKKHLFSLRTFGTLYLLFLSDGLVGDECLRRHVVDQLLNHPRATLACWLHPQPSQVPSDLSRALSVFPLEHVIAFNRRPGEGEFNVHELDDLSVRLFWIHHSIREGDWTL